MRISDWSSDVCSSDLVLALLLQIGNRPALLGRGEERREVELSVGSLQRDEEVEDLVVHPVRTGVRLVGLVHQHDRSEAARQRLGGDELGLRHRALGSIDQQQYRSEEHTSELQSLMRISYAVFCLKKNNHYSLNKKTRPHQHHQLHHQQNTQHQ